MMTLRGFFTRQGTASAVPMRRFENAASAAEGLSPEYALFSTRRRRRTVLVAQALLPVLLLIAATSQNRLPTSYRKQTQNPRRHSFHSPGPRQLRIPNPGNSEIPPRREIRIREIRLRSGRRPHHHATVSRIHARPLYRRRPRLLPRLRRSRRQRRLRRLHRPSHDQRFRRPAQRGPARPNYRQFQNPRRQRQHRRRRWHPLEIDSRHGWPNRIPRSTHGAQPGQFQFHRRCVGSAQHAVLPGILRR